MDAAQWDQRYAGQDLVWSAEPNRFVAEECRLLLPGEALDVAAGEGRNAIWLASRGWRVTAVDFSAVAVDKGRDLARSEGPPVADAINWVCADVRLWTPAPSSFDLVLIAYLHLPARERRQVLAHAVGALATGAMLLVVGHDTANLTGGVGGPQDPAVLYGPTDLVGDLARFADITVERAETVERPTAGGVALDALVRARRTG